jgi:hypothetical protein
MADKKDNEHQLNIELTDEMAEGTYSNLAIITHSFSEFIIDFVKVMPGTPKAKVKSRVILTPHHAKRLLKALKDNLGKYESSFGPIADTDPIMSGPFPFGGPTAQA